MESNSFKKLFINALFVVAILLGLYVGIKIDPLFAQKALQGDFSGLFKVGLVTFGFLIIVIIISIKTTNKNRKIADSKLLKPSDLKAEQIRMKNEGIFFTKPLFKNNKHKFYTDTSALQLSRNVKLSTKASYTHTIVFGPTGSGKSAAFFIPILRNINGNSIIVTDPKGELHDKTKDYLEYHGYEVLHLNFNDPNKSDYYSLLGSCKDHSDVNKLAESIMGQGSAANDDWTKMSKPLFAAFLFHEFDKGEKNMSNVVKHMSKVGANEDLLDEFFEYSSSKALEMYKMFKGSMGSMATVGSIISTINGKIEVFTYEKVQRLSNRSSFSADNFRLKKSALFVSYPEDEAVVYAPYIASFFYQIMSSIKAHPSMYEGVRGKKGNGVHFLLDEFANIGTLPELDTFLSTIRSKEMSVMLGIQSFDQIKVRYKDRTNTIVENCKTKIVLPGTTGATAKFFSELVGEEAHNSLSVSSSKNRDTSVSESQQKKMILSQDQIRRMTTNDVIFVSDNLKPCIDIKNLYYLSTFEQIVDSKLPFSSSINLKIARFFADKLGFNKKTKAHEKEVEDFAKRRDKIRRKAERKKEKARANADFEIKSVERDKSDFDTVQARREAMQRQIEEEEKELARVTPFKNEDELLLDDKNDYNNDDFMTEIDEIEIPEVDFDESNDDSIEDKEVRNVSDGNDRLNSILNSINKK